MERLAAQCSGEDAVYTLVKVTPSHLKLWNQMIAPEAKGAPDDGIDDRWRSVDSVRCSVLAAWRIPAGEAGEPLWSHGDHGGLLHRLRSPGL